jgi:S-sulfosulfanyl-L-cysteine sulfohydrolase
MLKTPIHRITLNHAPMERLIADAYLHQTGASFSHGLSYGAPITPGLVTMKDLYNIIPTNPELFLIELDGMTLLQALETNLGQLYSDDQFQQKGYFTIFQSEHDL